MVTSVLSAFILFFLFDFYYEFHVVLYKPTCAELRNLFVKKLIFMEKDGTNRNLLITVVMKGRTASLFILAMIRKFVQELN